MNVRSGVCILPVIVLFGGGLRAQPANTTAVQPVYVSMSLSTNNLLTLCTPDALIKAESLLQSELSGVAHDNVPYRDFQFSRDKYPQLRVTVQDGDAFRLVAELYREPNQRPSLTRSVEWKPRGVSLVCTTDWLYRQTAAKLKELLGNGDVLESALLPIPLGHLVLPARYQRYSVPEFIVLPLAWKSCSTLAYSDFKVVYRRALPSDVDQYIVPAKGIGKCMEYPDHQPFQPGILVQQAVPAKMKGAQWSSWKINEFLLKNHLDGPASPIGCDSFVQFRQARN